MRVTNTIKRLSSPSLIILNRFIASLIMSATLALTLSEGNHIWSMLSMLAPYQDRCVGCMLHHSFVSES